MGPSEWDPRMGPSGWGRWGLGWGLCGGWDPTLKCDLLCGSLGVGAWKWDLGVRTFKVGPSVGLGSGTFEVGPSQWDPRMGP